MASIGSKTVSLSCAFLLASCSGMSGDWPNLSDPLPDASERERVLERGEPTPFIAPDTQTRGNPLTQSTAIKLLTAVKADSAQAKKVYLASKEAVDAAEGEEKEIAWHETQLLLTRLSHNTDRLDSIIYADQLKPHNIWEQAKSFQSMIDVYVAAERQALNQLKP